jgi:hypothetical protein
VYTFIAVGDAATDARVTGPARWADPEKVITAESAAAWVFLPLPHDWASV